MLLRMSILAALEDFFYIDLCRLCGRMLWLHRSLIPTQESVERRGLADTTGSAHGIAVLPSGSAIYDVENAGPALRPRAYEAAGTLLDLALRDRRPGRVLSAMWRWHRDIYERHE